MSPIQVNVDRSGDPWGIVGQQVSVFRSGDHKIKHCPIDISSTHRQVGDTVYPLKQDLHDDAVVIIAIVIVILIIEMCSSRRGSNPPTVVRPSSPSDT